LVFALVFGLLKAMLLRLQLFERDKLICRGRGYFIFVLVFLFLFGVIFVNFSDILFYFRLRFSLEYLAIILVLDK
jgi:hypothetical protein